MAGRRTEKWTWQAINPLGIRRPIDSTLLTPHHQGGPALLAEMRTSGAASAASWA